MSCIPVVCQVAGAAGGATAGAIAHALLSGMAFAVERSAAWVVDHVLALVAQSTSIDVGAPWFAGRMRSMVTLMALLLAPLLLAGTLSAVLHQDLRRLARTWVVGLPVAVVATMVAIRLTTAALQVTDAMTQVVTSGVKVDVYQVLAATPAAPGSPPGVALALAVVILLGALAVWLELVVRSAAVYVAVFFLPLALAGLVWPATAHLTRRLVEGLVALILTKFVIVATLSLGAAAVQDGRGVDQVASGAAVLLIAAFAPFVLFRMVPIVEAASLSHLAGLSRQPLRAASSGAGRAAAMVGHAEAAVAGLRGGSDPAGVGSTVADQAVATATPTYPTGADAEPHDRDDGR